MSDLPGLPKFYAIFTLPEGCLEILHKQDEAIRVAKKLATQYPDGRRFCVMEVTHCLEASATTVSILPEDPVSVSNQGAP